ncbi:MAG: type III pantothenate kinase [Planctomycetota bacterium]
MAALLTLDLGNTNASLAHRAGDASVVLLASGASDDLGWLEAALREAPEAERAALSAVGGRAAEAEGAELLGRIAAVHVRPDAGLTMAIRNPETCGTDRQYAMRAALEDARAAGASRALVVDAGTALTVDAGEWRAEAPVFRGGAIALGPGSAADALARAGARLPDVELQPDAPALGRSTPEALTAGVVVGFRGAVRELCREIGREAFGGTRGVRAYLTGGARAFADPVFDDLGLGAPAVDPLLVHRGLALALGPKPGPAG